MKVGVANATEKNFDLHVAVRWIPTRNCGRSQWRCLTGGGIGFRFVSAWMHTSILCNNALASSDGIVLCSLSNLSRIVSPVQERLSLSATAIEITRFTVFFQLRHVSANGAPTGDLPQVILAAAPAIISAIPLDPASRIFGVNPTFAPPFRQWLRRVHPKIVHRRSRPI